MTLPGTRPMAIRTVVRPEQESSEDDEDSFDQVALHRQVTRMQMTTYSCRAERCLYETDEDGKTINRYGREHVGTGDAHFWQIFYFYPTTRGEPVMFSCAGPELDRRGRSHYMHFGCGMHFDPDTNKRQFAEHLTQCRLNPRGPTAQAYFKKVDDPQFEALALD